MDKILDDVDMFYINDLDDLTDLEIINDFGIDVFISKWRKNNRHSFLYTHIMNHSLMPLNRIVEHMIMIGLFTKNIDGENLTN
jgi:hypothetical protein